MDEQPFSLWSFITSDANQIRQTLGTRLFLNNLSSKLLTKIQFEYYLSGARKRRQRQLTLSR
jgi:hypothetical protein